MAQRETAAPAGTGHGGKGQFYTLNNNPTDAKKQDEPRDMMNGGRAA